MKAPFLIENEASFPFVGAEDLDSTDEKLNVETLEYDQEDRHQSDEHRQLIREKNQELTKGKQAEGLYVGRTPYGYQKAGDELEADPEQAPVVRKIFELFINGYKPNDIRRYLRNQEVKSPTGDKEWNLPGIKRILQREIYCGAEHAESLIGRESFEQAKENFSDRKIQKDNSEADCFPMAICGVCGKKLTFKRSRKIYLCDRHTGEAPKEKRLEHAPKISAQELKQIVTQQYNEHIFHMKNMQDEPIWITDLCLEERGQDKIELGNKLLGLDPESDDYLAEVKAVSEEYSGLWLDWVQALRNLKDDYYRTLLRNNLPDIWRPMYQLDAAAVSRAVSSIILKEDGSVETHFKAEEVF